MPLCHNEPALNLDKTFVCPFQVCAHKTAVMAKLGLVNLETLVSTVKEVRQSGRPKRRAPALERDDIPQGSDEEEDEVEAEDHDADPARIPLCLRRPLYRLRSASSRTKKCEQERNDWRTRTSKTSIRTSSQVNEAALGAGDNSDDEDDDHETILEVC